jgi:hypothetical protein
MPLLLLATQCVNVLANFHNQQESKMKVAANTAASSVTWNKGCVQLLFYHIITISTVFCVHVHNLAPEV